MAGRNYTPREFTANCTQCGQLFSYMHHTGQRPKLCSVDCRRAAHRDQCKKARPDLAPCSVKGCANRAVRVGAVLCEKHYGRVRRGVSMEDRKFSYRYTTQHGYVLRTCVDHPLATDRRVYEHRVVAYEKHRGECPPCFWCGLGLTWDEAVVDHLDDNKANNDPTNLEVACSPCNRARGSLIPFIGRMRPQAVGLFVSLVKARNAECHDTKTAQEAAERASLGR